MAKFTKDRIQEIENTLRLHINYKGVSSGGKYLRQMYMIVACSWGYSGAPAIALSNMLDDYFQQVGVKNLDEALERLRKLE